MSEFDEVLKAVCSLGGGGVPSISRSAGVGEGFVRAVLGVLLSEGIIREVDLSGGCGSCPLRRICPHSDLRLQGRVKIYVITEKGRRICNALRRGGAAGI